MDLSIMPRWASWDKGKMANCVRWASYRRNLALCQGGEEEIDLRRGATGACLSIVPIQVLLY